MGSKEEFGFKELVVWQKAVEFARHVIEKTEVLNSEKQHYRLKEQTESAAASIAANIAEGKGRFSKKEFRQYLYIARGSVYETITFLNILKELHWLSETEVKLLEDEGLVLNKMLNALINSIKTN